MDFSKRPYRGAILAFLGVMSFWTGVTSAKVLLNASGSTFMFPIESVWSRVYERSDPKVAINSRSDRVVASVSLCSG